MRMAVLLTITFGVTGQENQEIRRLGLMVLGMLLKVLHLHQAQDFGYRDFPQNRGFSQQERLGSLMWR